MSGANRLFEGAFRAALFLCLLLLFAPVVLLLVRALAGGAGGWLDARLMRALWLSVWTASASTLLCLVLALPGAYALSRLLPRGSRLVRGLIRMPLALPHLVAGVALLLTFARTPLAAVLSRLGVEVLFTPLGVVAAQWFVNLPYMLGLLTERFDAIEPSEEFMARSLGASRAQAFWHVTLPAAAGGLVSASVLCFSRAMGEFGAVMMLAGAVRERTETLPIAIYLNMATGDLDGALKVATVLVLLSLATVALVGLLEGERGDKREEKAC